MTPGVNKYEFALYVSFSAVALLVSAILIKWFLVVVVVVGDSAKFNPSHLFPLVRNISLDLNKLESLLTKGYFVPSWHSRTTTTITTDKR